MSMLHITRGIFRLNDTRTVNLNELMVQSGESWAFVGANGSGKSSLPRALSGELAPMKGSLVNRFLRPWRLSLEQLQQRVEDEWQRNNTDMLSVDEEDTGYLVSEVIQEESKDEALVAQLAHSETLAGRWNAASTGKSAARIEPVI
ncbi:ATP-binding cassette domain-containing protein [Erwinia pyrifoliae]|uniref:ATP-binding cassette domain-containing protein n=1 Tax=Erwinia pyrifoliae TaxID=79967 RepID=UPI0035CD184D